MIERRSYIMNEECKKNLTPQEIFMEFGKDDDMGACNRCPNLEYKGGMMTCKLIEEGKK